MGDIILLGLLISESSCSALPVGEEGRLAIRRYGVQLEQIGGDDEGLKIRNLNLGI